MRLTSGDADYVVTATKAADSKAADENLNLFFPLSTLVSEWAAPKCLIIVQRNERPLCANDS